MNRSFTLLVFLLTAGLEPDLWAGERTPSNFHVPDGFIIEQVAGEADVVFPMFAVFDDRGRLFVTESSGGDLYAELTALTRKCRIKLLQEHTGRFRTTRVFADKLVFPMGLAWRNDKLYVADPPDLVTLEDTSNTGQADKRTVILTSFGHTDNGSLHGLIFGPDGLLYMTTGWPDGYKFTLPGGRLLQGQSGALIRCRPDGSEPEVLCRGFANLVEIVFTPRGEIIGTDNWFQRPSGGNRDALVHLAEGGQYPMQDDVGTSLPVTGELLPPMSMFPAVALSGLMHYRGLAFPAEMRGNLFSAQHNARKVMRHVLIPDGSTFRTKDFDFVTSNDPDFHPSDVVEAPDGSLVVIDTGSWYVHHCPTGQIRKTPSPGGIYRVRAIKAKAVPDPLGLKVDWKNPSADALPGLLGDRRPLVRDKAQQVLSSRGKEAVTALAAVLAESRDITARQHAVWALAAIADESALPALRQALHDADPDIAAPAARALGFRKDRRSAPQLGKLLGSQTPPVRMAAAQALAHCGTRESLPALWKALEAEPDRFLEHSLAHAIHWLADQDDLLAALKNPHPRVQKVALLLFDQPPPLLPALPPSVGEGSGGGVRGKLTDQMVMQRMTVADEELRQTALRILQKHPEWSDQAMGLLREWLRKPKLSEEQERGLRGTILAFQKKQPVQELIAKAIANAGGQTPPDRRILVLETLAQTSLNDLPKTLRDALFHALQEPVVRKQVLATVAVLQLPQFDEALAKLAESPAESAEVRLEALRAIVGRLPNLSSLSFQFLCDQLRDPQRPIARLAAAEVLGRSRLTAEQLGKILQAVHGDSLISPTVLLPALKHAANKKTSPAILDYLAQAIRHGWKPSESELEKFLTSLPAEVRGKAGPLRELLRQSAERARARLEEFEALLTGGNVQRGQDIFFGKKVACAACHRIGIQGSLVGPDLTKIGASRAGRDILESILVPSSTIAQGYESYSLVTADGRSATGVIARQTADTLVLRDSTGAELRYRKDQIQEMNRLTTSIMPEGQERALSKEEFRDLLAFLQSLK